MLNFVFSSVPEPVEPRVHSSKDSLQQSFQDIFEEPAKVVRPQKSIVNSLLEQAQVFVPRYSNFKKHLSDLENKIKSAFLKEGLAVYPAFSISVDFDNNYIIISEERADHVKIESLLNSSEEIRKMIPQIFAIGSHIVNIADSVAFREEYSRSDQPDQVITKYNELFNDYRRMKEFSLRFDRCLIILCDKEVWACPVKEN